MVQLFLINDDGTTEQLFTEVPLQTVLESDKCYIIISEKNKRIYLWEGSNIPSRRSWSIDSINLSILRENYKDYEITMRNEGNETLDLLEIITRMPARAPITESELQQSLNFADLKNLLQEKQKTAQINYNYTIITDIAQWEKELRIKEATKVKIAEKVSDICDKCYYPVERRSDGGFGGYTCPNCGRVVEMGIVFKEGKVKGVPYGEPVFGKNLSLRTRLTILVVSTSIMFLIMIILAIYMGGFPGF